MPTFDASAAFDLIRIPCLLNLRLHSLQKDLENSPMEDIEPVFTPENVRRNPLPPKVILWLLLRIRIIRLSNGVVVLQDEKYFGTILMPKLQHIARSFYPPHSLTFGMFFRGVLPLEGSYRLSQGARFSGKEQLFGL